MSPPIILFSFFIDHPGIARRLIYFTDAGYRVSLVGVARGDVMPVELSTNVESVFKSRKGILGGLSARLKACWALLKLIRTNRNPVIVARALPAATIAAFLARYNREAVVIYGIFDIHPRQADPGFLNSLIKMVERKVLSNVDVLALTSPGFLNEFYRKRHERLPKVFIWENKIPKSFTERFNIIERTTKAHDFQPTFRQNKAPRIVYPGTLRCEDSLAILSQVACTHKRCELHLWGRAKNLTAFEFAGSFKGGREVCYHGVYAYPDQLPEVYEDMEFCWAIDAVRSTDNSAWLLPNRIYEAAFFRVPVIALAGTYTARWVEQNGTGFILPKISESSICRLLDDVTEEDYLGVINKLQTMEQSKAIDTNTTTELIESALKTSSLKTAAHNAT